MKRYDYDAFGNIRWHSTNTFEGVPNRYTFQGREYDAHRGDYFYRNRIYVPEWGSFTGPDMNLSRGPLGEPNGVGNYVAFNNNPLVYTDPDGRHPVALLAAGLVWWVLDKYAWAPDESITVDQIVAADEAEGVNDAAMLLSLAAGAGTARAASSGLATLPIRGGVQRLAVAELTGMSVGATYDLTRQVADDRPGVDVAQLGLNTAVAGTLAVGLDGGVMAIGVGGRWVANKAVAGVNSVADRMVLHATLADARINTLASTKRFYADAFGNVADMQAALQRPQLIRIVPRSYLGYRNIASREATTAFAGDAGILLSRPRSTKQLLENIGYTKGEIAAHSGRDMAGFIIDGSRVPQRIPTAFRHELFTGKGYTLTHHGAIGTYEREIPNLLQDDSRILRVLLLRGQ